MGMFEVKVGLAHPFQREFHDHMVIVDTGAHHSVFPASVLENLAIEPCDTAIVMLGDGKTVEFPLGEARLRMEDGRERTIPVLFGSEDDLFLLGATTLQIFGLVPDTTDHRLVPSRLLVVGMRATPTTGSVIQGKPLFL